jgi:predicted nucleic acid-binding protein
LILLLDTTVLVDVLRRRKDRLTLLEELVEMGHRLTTSAMCVAEVYAGMRPGEEERTQGLLAGVPCYPISMSIAVRAGELKREWARKGRTLTLTDMMIAATALEHGLRLATDNRKDFPMDEIAFYPLP